MERWVPGVGGVVRMQCPQSGGVKAPCSLTSQPDRSPAGWQWSSEKKTTACVENLGRLFAESCSWTKSHDVLDFSFYKPAHEKTRKLDSNGEHHIAIYQI